MTKQIMSKESWCNICSFIGGLPTLLAHIIFMCKKIVKKSQLENIQRWVCIHYKEFYRLSHICQYMRQLVLGQIIYKKLAFTGTTFNDRFYMKFTRPLSVKDKYRDYTTLGELQDMISWGIQVFDKMKK